MSGDNPSLGMLSAAITDLAQKVEAIDARAGRAGAAGGPSDQMEGRVRAIESVLTEVRTAGGKHAQTKARDDAQKAMRRPWHMLDADEAVQRWLELRAWVDWFAVRNDIGPKDIPDCWYLHGGLVDELEALRWAWLDTHRPESKGIDPLWWREALHRARAAGRCSTRTGAPPRTLKPAHTPWAVNGSGTTSSPKNSPIGWRLADQGQLVPARPVVDERERDTGEQ